MLRLPHNFDTRIQRGEIPSIYVVILTDRGFRVYMQVEPTGVFDDLVWTGSGSFTANGFVTGGNGTSFIEKSNRLKEIGNIEKMIASRDRDAIDNLGAKERQTITIVLDNSDYHFSKLLPTELFLTKIVLVYIGFDMDDFSDHIFWFQGKITVVNISPPDLIIEAEEK